MPKACRYSEDLDYVRRSGGGIGSVMSQLTRIGKELGYKVNTQISKYPKVFWKTAAESGQPIKIKIEINTYERTPALPLVMIRHEVASGYYTGCADVRTFQAEEMAATKVRALYQRSKGRDLFDLWLMLEIHKLDPYKIIKSFEHYRPEAFSSVMAIENLEMKLNNERFLEDLAFLAVSFNMDYQPKAAGEIVVNKLLCLL